MAKLSESEVKQLREALLDLAECVQEDRSRDPLEALNHFLSWRDKKEFLKILKKWCAETGRPRKMIIVPSPPGTPEDEAWLDEIPEEQGRVFAREKASGMTFSEIAKKYALEKYKLDPVGTRAWVASVISRHKRWIQKARLTWETPTNKPTGNSRSTN